MNPKKWTYAKQIFADAVELTNEQRAKYLEDACAGDGELIGLVQTMLANDAPAGSFMETPPVVCAEPMSSYLGKHIGPYKVERLLGQGGMGSVYAALRDDGNYSQRVAVKLIKRGMDSEEIVKRFRHERQILANLDHPNIARLLDGGMTEEGLPYFVMEYIEGHPVDEYCNSHRLNITARLQLFRAVCAAVQYAHQRAIVHRDLKPGNILVTAEGAPKLLDFGIAKLLEPDSAFTAFSLTHAGAKIMTPEYASPEQVRGEAVTPASDVYTLGLLLYELLTGRRPYLLQTRTLKEIETAVCEQEPELPSAAILRPVEQIASGGMVVTLTPQSVSATREGTPETLRRRLRGDLDRITLKALRKEPARRYVSVEQFSEDIHRHLEGLPVRARRNSAWYRSEKFLQKHKNSLLVAGTTAMILIAGAQIAPRLRSRLEVMIPALEVPSRHEYQVEPVAANYQRDSRHTITATMKSHGLPMVGIPVNFEVIAGPNRGIVDSASTNVQGQASITYRGDRLGTDTIRVSSDYGDSSYVRSVQASWFPEGTLFGPLGAAIGTLAPGDGISGGISGEGYRFSESLIEAHGFVTLNRIAENRLAMKVELRNGDPYFKYAVEIFEAARETGNSDLGATGAFLQVDQEGNGKVELVLPLPYAPPKHHILGDGRGTEALIVVLDWVDSQKGGDRFSTDPLPLPAWPNER